MVALDVSAGARVALGGHAVPVVYADREFPAAPLDPPGLFFQPDLM